MSRKRSSGIDLVTATDRGAWGDEDIRALPSAVALERRISTTRPHPPAHLTDEDPERFEPDAAFAEWIRGTFVDASGPLANVEHEHLADAKIGVLWTNAVCMKQMRHVLATAELPSTMGSRWKQARFEQQIRDWFGASLDFLLTFYAPSCEDLDHRAFCALVEHELYHCAQAEDRYGAPRFDRVTGEPVYAIKGHDVEEFTGVVRRYGVTSPEVRAFVRAANARPFFDEGPINIACGTCDARVA